ncbi:ABC transporter permease [Streptomyces sp. RKND-216]|uniref:ABC transporter permease n=1 Tax=Streptomyces sp. RKND-216 TaxID=2562581 RepID=UPI00109DBF2B|nr:ABC transporter permease [Streptomyces sp. RKND-216]THA27139.1 ABC transporter permease [Streptomyces sp. RKND-216]
MNGTVGLAALTVEGRKTSASRAVLVTTVLLVVGIALLAGSLTWAAARGNERVLAQLGPLAGEAGWDRLMGVVAQVTAAASLLGFGTVLSWMFGREFTEGTISGLFALPVSRPAVAAAKLAVYLLWALGVAALLTALLGAVGTALRLGAVDAGVTGALARQFTLTALSALLALPAAWAATLGRGLLPGIATTVGILVVAQVVAVAGTGAWFPFTAPALWALHPAGVSPAQLALVGLVPVVFVPAVLLTWHRLQLDR